MAKLQKRFKILIISLLILLVPIFLFYGVFTIPALLEGDFRYKECYSTNSDDNLKRLVIERRAAFPANEYVDTSRY